jgi:hypothetical protein
MRKRAYHQPLSAAAGAAEYGKTAEGGLGTVVQAVMKTAAARLRANRLRRFVLWFSGRL